MDWRGDQIWDKVGVRVYEAGFSCLACTRCLKYKLLGFREGRKGVVLNLSPTMDLLLQGTLARSNTIAQNKLNKDS